MKKRRLMTPWLASVLLLASVCMETTVYADEPIKNDEIAIVEERIPLEEDSTTDEMDSSGAKTVPEQDKETDSEQLPEEKEPSDEDKQDSDEKKETVSISANEMYQGDETTLEADGFCDEDAKEILHEVFVITIPLQLTTGTLTKPVFEDAEVTVLIDGEEILTEEEVIDLGVKVEEIGIRVKPLGDVLKQMQKLVLTLANGSSEESESVVETVLHRFFKDGSEESTELQLITVQLKGIRPVTEPDAGTDIDRELETEIPEGQEPGIIEIPEEKQDEKKEESDSEETKPQKTPVEQIVEIIDHSGQNLMESTASVQGSSNHSISTSTALANRTFGLDWLSPQKIETASVEEVDESFKDKDVGSNHEDEDYRKGSVIWKENKPDKQSEKENSIPVPAILLAVAAAAGALFVPLAKKRQSNSKEENGMN